MPEGTNAELQVKCETKDARRTVITHHFLLVSSYAYLFLFLPGINYERTRIKLMSFLLTNTQLLGKVCSYV
jgi:hypothetical protein